MFQYTHNNYLQMGYNGLPLTPRKAFTDRASIHITERAKYIPTSFKEEVVRAAKLIYEDHGKVSLCISGGVDSQCMLYAFIEAKVPFDIVIWRMNDGLNDFDAIKAINLCNKLKLQYTIVEKDIVKWMESDEYIETIHQLKTGWHGLHNRIPFYTHNYENPIVMGHGEICNIDYIPEMGYFTGNQPMVRHVLNNMSFNYDIKIIVSFFQYTPELILSQLTPDMLNAYNNYVPDVEIGFKFEDVCNFNFNKKVTDGLINARSDMKFFKFMLYTEAFADLVIPAKYHGSEGLREKHSDMWINSGVITEEISNMSAMDASHLEIPIQFDGERIEGHNFLRSGLVPENEEN